MYVTFWLVHSSELSLLLICRNCIVLHAAEISNNWIIIYENKIVLDKCTNSHSFVNTELFCII